MKTIQKTEKPIYGDFETRLFEVADSNLIFTIFSHAFNFLKIQLSKKGLNIIESGHYSNNALNLRYGKYREIFFRLKLSRFL